jgi:signal peptidase I
VQHGDIVVFHYPVNPQQHFVKRVIGIPGDRIRIVNKQVYRNGRKLDEPYKYHKMDYMDPYRDNFPGQPYIQLGERAEEMLRDHVRNGEVIVRPLTVWPARPSASTI